MGQCPCATVIISPVKKGRKGLFLLIAKRTVVIITMVAIAPTGDDG
jgi:hypothetical protein